MNALINLLVGIVAREAANEFRHRRPPKPAVPICDACHRHPAKVRCPRHKRVMCKRCLCPECKEINARIKAGTPRTPANYPPKPPHDPATCQCPWCCHFDGPNSTNPQAGMQ